MSMSDIIRKLCGPYEDHSKDRMRGRKSDQILSEDMYMRERIENMARCIEDGPMVSEELVSYNNGPQMLGMTTLMDPNLTLENYCRDMYEKCRYIYSRVKNSNWDGEETYFSDGCGNTIGMRGDPDNGLYVLVPLKQSLQKGDPALWLVWKRREGVVSAAKGIVNGKGGLRADKIIEEKTDQVEVTTWTDGNQEKKVIYDRYKEKLIPAHLLKQYEAKSLPRLEHHDPKPLPRRKTRARGE